MSRSLVAAASVLALGTTVLAAQLPASASPPGSAPGVTRGGAPAAVGSAGAGAASPASATAAGDELSVSTRLADRREVSAGTRAYSLGFEDGGFHANGWHITGEMGGVWTPPMKMVDGVWFG